MSIYIGFNIKYQQIDFLHVEYVDATQYFKIQFKFHKYFPGNRAIYFSNLSEENAFSPSSIKILCPLSAGPEKARSFSLQQTKENSPTYCYDKNSDGNRRELSTYLLTKTRFDTNSDLLMKYLSV